MLAAKQKAWGSMSLYFGCRRSNVDYIYKDEMKKAQVSGAITDLHVAFSREPNKPKVHIYNELGHLHSSLVLLCVAAASKLVAMCKCVHVLPDVYMCNSFVMSV